MTTTVSTPTEQPSASFEEITARATEHLATLSQLELQAIGTRIRVDTAITGLQLGMIRQRLIHQEIANLAAEIASM